MIVTIIIFITTLLILVVVHEFGHFIMAKKFNIRVLEFGFGIPPKIFGKKVGETTFSLNWLPIGGFVKLLGEDEVSKKILENHRSFAAQVVWKRILVVVAGVSMNLILAWILFYIVLGFQGFKFQIPLIVEHKFVGVSQEVESHVVIAQIAKDSPAENKGLKVGERILSIDGENIDSDQQLITKTKSLAGKTISVTLQDPQSRQSRIIQVVPRQNPPEGQGPLGIAVVSFRVANLEYQTPLEKLFSGPSHSLNLTAYSFRVFGRVINQSFARKTFEPISQSVAGPVGITSLANSILTSSKNPLLPYLDFVGLLSLNLAVVNVLPIPALDGGRLLFLLIEMTTKKKMRSEIEGIIHRVGFALLLTLALLITFSDIRKLFS